MAAFVDLIYRCCILIFFSMKCYTHVGCSTSGPKSCKTLRSPGLSSKIDMLKELNWESHESRRTKIQSPGLQDHERHG